MKFSFVKKRLALLLALLLIFSALPPITVYAESGLPVTYAYNNTDRGSAGGVISFTPNYTGTVDLYWGAAGQRLEGYTALSPAPLSVTNGSLFSFKVQEFTAIPKGVTSLLGYNGSSQIVFEYDIPASKQFDYGNTLIKFGALSDPHFGNRYGNWNIPRNAFNNAADFLGSQGVDLIGISGDISDAGTAAEYADYQTSVNSFTTKYPKVPVYTITGNHDATSGGLNLTRWKQYTEDSVNYTGDLVRKYASNNLDFTVDFGSDNVFVFFNQQRWASDYIYGTGQMDWLAATLAANADKRVYLFVHQYLDKTSGDLSNGYYKYNGPIPNTAAEGQRMLALMETYKNVVMFTGHSHWMYYLQFLVNQRPDNATYGVGAVGPNASANIFDGDGKYGAMVHVGSVTEPRDLLGTNSNRTDRPGVESEGYLVEVYEDCVILKGYDFMRNRYYAFANYIVMNPFAEDDGSIKGSGTKADPYIIANEANFKEFTDNMISDPDYYAGKYLKQTADLNMAGVSGYNGVNENYFFKGFYDGGGHRINVNISSSTNNNIFPRIGQLGQNAGIINLGTTGSVTSTGQYAAGIARSQGGSDGTYAFIVNCWSTVNVTSSSTNGNSAGIVNTIRGVVSNTVFAGNLTGNSRQAVTGSSGTISNTVNAYFYNTGAAPAYSTGVTTIDLAQLTGTAAATLNGNLDDAATRLGTSGYIRADLIEWVHDYSNQYPVLADGVVRDITIDPPSANLDQGGTRQLSATVVGNITPASKAVSWTSSSPANVSVSASGLVTVSASAAGGTYAITATSVSDPSKSARTIITVTAVTGISGSGTYADPYIIASEANFKEFTDNMRSGNEYAGRYFLQTADINMAGVSGYNGLDENYFFKGFYNGGGHKINVAISSSGNNNIFPRIGQADQNSGIINLGTTGSVSGGQYVAGIARSQGGSDGTYAFIVNCWTSVNVTATTNAAGIVNTIRGMVSNTVSWGNLTGSSRQAVTGSSGTTSNTVNAYYYNTGGTLQYSTGATSITQTALTTTQAATMNGNLTAAAGRLGTSAYTRADLIEWCQDYATQYPVFVDGIVRDVTLSQTSANLARGDTLQLTAAVVGNLAAASKTVNWTSSSPANVSVSTSGLVTVSAGAAGGTYTITATSATDASKFRQASITVAASSSITGSGTKADPYIIASEANFKEFTDNMLADPTGANYSGKYFKQTANINMAGVSGYNGIGATCYFRGYYDGGGHVINANISGALDNCLFPRLSSDTAGNEGVIMNLGTTGTISSLVGAGTTSYAAGIARSMQAGAMIVNCWSTMALTADRAAGITPTPRGSGVVNCLFAGALGGPNAGAISHEQGTSANVINCYFYNANNATLGSNNGTGYNTVTLTVLTTTLAGTLSGNRANAATRFSTTSGFVSADLVEWCQDYTSPNYPVFVDGIVRDVTVSPPSAGVTQGGTQQLTATVIGNLAAASKAVSWTSTGGANVSVSSSGLVTVSASATPGAYTVRATSAVDSSKFADVVITVTAAGLTDAESVAAAKTALTWAVIRNSNTLQSEVTTNLTLSAAGAEQTVISWASNNTAVISTAGVVTRPSYTAGDANVTLTATITKGTASDTVVFNLTVLKNLQSDADAVAEAKAALTWDAIRNANTLQTAVTTNLTLITSGLAGTSIGWQSSNPSVVSAAGVVTRPSYTAGDAGVTLTATISRGGVSEYVTFNLTVTKLPKSNAEAVAEAKAALTWDVIRNANAEQTAVTTNLNLITSFIEDTQVNWTTDNSIVITTGGVVTRPAYTASDANVRLTAQIRRIDAIDYVVFDLTVLKNVQTDAEAVAEAKAALTWDVIRAANTLQTAVTTNLNLITSGSAGTTVSWASNNTAVVSEQGVVVRPAADVSDASVRIVATITKGGSSEQVVFDLIVLKTSAITGIGVLDLVITPVGANGFNAAATVVNNTAASAPDISIIIAAYDAAGKMVAMSIKDVPINANSSGQISVDLNVTGKNVHIVKAFVWNDYIPICPDATLYL